MNVVDKKVYIGQSVHIEYRWKEHILTLRHNKHDNEHLQRAWNRYGEQSFVFDVVEELQTADPEILCEREDFWIEFYSSTDPSKGYNIKRGLLNLPMPLEVRKKISVALKGRKPSPQTIAAAIVASKSPERRKKLSQSLQGRKQSEEHRAKNRKVHIGLHQTEETKQKISAAIVEHKHIKENPPRFYYLSTMWGTKPFHYRCRCSWYSSLEEYNAVLAKEANKKKQDFHWFTDGICDVKAKECPEGFWPGRSFRKKSCTTKRGQVNV